MTNRYLSGVFAPIAEEHTLTDLEVNDWVRLPNGMRVQVGAVEGGPLEFVGACILVFDEDPEPTILGADVYDDVQLT